jgi:site-specific DNA-methyltransferase (adenine-specific)
MKKLPNEYIDLIITDPPYGINYQNNYTLKTHDVLEGDNGIDYQLFANEIYRVLKNNSAAYIFTRFDVYPFHYNCLANAGFHIKNCLVIEKGHIGGVGDLKGSFANNSEWIIYCTKGRKEFNQTKLMKNSKPAGKKCAREGNPIQEYKTRFNSCWFGDEFPKSTYNSSWQKKNNIFHPTIKNTECLKWFILISSNEGDLICDPFMGSGSTAISTIETNRNYLGFEISTTYWDLSNKRIQDIVSE